MISLAHIKAPAAPLDAPEKKVMAWSGGKLTTNKEEATLKFLKKKLERGESLTEPQKAVIAKFTLSSRRGGDIMQQLESVVAVKRGSEAVTEQEGGAKRLKDSRSRFVVNASGGFETNRDWKQKSRDGSAGSGRGGKGSGKGGGKGKGGQWGGATGVKMLSQAAKSRPALLSSSSMLDSGLSSSR